MTIMTVSATEFSRGLSDFLNQVQYQSQVLDIERGKRIIARVSPVTLIGGFPLGQLDALLANGPRLPADDAEVMTNDLRGARGNMLPRPDPWAS
jgi:hypothetical protein